MYRSLLSFNRLKAKSFIFLAECEFKSATNVRFVHLQGTKGVLFQYTGDINCFCRANTSSLPIKRKGSEGHLQQSEKVSKKGLNMDEPVKLWRLLLLAINREDGTCFCLLLSGFQVACLAAWVHQRRPLDSTRSFQLRPYTCSVFSFAHLYLSLRNLS